MSRLATTGLVNSKFFGMAPSNHTFPAVQSRPQVQAECTIPVPSGSESSRDTAHYLLIGSWEVKRMSKRVRQENDTDSEAHLDGGKRLSQKDHTILAHPTQPAKQERAINQLLLSLSSCLVQENLSIFANNESQQQHQQYQHQHQQTHFQPSLCVTRAAIAVAVLNSTTKIRRGVEVTTTTTTRIWT